MEEEVPDDLACSICLGYLRDAVHVSCCFSLYCKKCVTDWLAQKSTCPLCSRGKPQVSPNVPIQRMVVAHLEQKKNASATTKNPSPPKKGKAITKESSPQVAKQGEEISFDALRELTSMGFEERAAKGALRSSGSSMEGALSILLGERVEGDIPTKRSREEEVATFGNNDDDDNDDDDDDDNDNDENDDDEDQDDDDEQADIDLMEADPVVVENLRANIALLQDEGMEVLLRHLHDNNLSLNLTSMTKHDAVMVDKLVQDLLAQQETQKVTKPTTLQQLMQLAEQTKQRTEQALLELRDELRQRAQQHQASSVQKPKAKGGKEPKRRRGGVAAAAAAAAAVAPASPASVASSSPHPSPQAGFPNCFCGLVAVRRQVTKQGGNFGRLFFGCSQYGTANHCSYFAWDKSVPFGVPPPLPALAPGPVPIARSSRRTRVSSRKRN